MERRCTVQARVGHAGRLISYRSSIDYTLNGDVSTTTASGAVFQNPLANFPARADIKFPDMAILSVVQQFGDKWQLLGDLQYTNWSTVGTIDVINTQTGGDGRPAVTSTSTTPGGSRWA